MEQQRCLGPGRALYEGRGPCDDTGPIYGRDANEKMYNDLFQKVHFINHWTSIVVRDGDACRDRMQIWNVASAPAK
jgi:hypothetical protein